MPTIYASAMKDLALLSVNYRNCLRDSGGAQRVEMTVRGWDFRSVRKLPRHTSGSSPHGIVGMERSLYSPTAWGIGKPRRRLHCQHPGLSDRPQVDAVTSGFTHEVN